MSRLIILFTTLLVLGAWPTICAANTSDEPSKPIDKAPPTTSLDHFFQVGVGARIGTGYRLIVPYDDKHNCGEKDKSVCGGRQPFWLEVSPSFGVTGSLEVLLDIRFSLESDFTGSKALFFAPGIKYYTDPEDVFKFFATGQVVLEHQDQTNADIASFDIGIRSALGLQFDVLRYVGLFAQGGIILGFKRWLTFVIDFAVGLQARY